MRWRRLRPIPYCCRRLPTETTSFAGFWIKSRNDTDYSVRYRINLATLNTALSGNSKELDELNAFVGDLTKDTLKQVGAVTITGYSSPTDP